MDLLAASLLGVNPRGHDHRVPGPLTYRMYRFYRAQILGTFIVFFVVAVVLVLVEIFASSGPPLVFVAFWIVALLWNEYWFLWRISYKLVLDGDTLHWYAPLRHGSVQLADVSEIRRFKLGPSMARITVSNGPPVCLVVRKGLRDFVHAIQAEAPQVQVNLGWYAQLSEVLPGGRGFRP